jgi:hypothetical protein
MTKAEAIAYLRRLKQLEDDVAGTIPVIKAEVEEEMQAMETFREFEKDKRHDKEN